MRWSQVIVNPYQLRSMTSISNLRIIHEVTVSLKINNFKVHPSVLFIYFSTARFTFPLHTIYSIFPPSPSYLKHVWSEAEGRTRARVAREREDSEGRGFVRSVRNLFGAPEHCLEGGRQYSCTFAPVCWMTGGVATPGE